MEPSSSKLFQECNGHRYIEDDEREMTEPELKLHRYTGIEIQGESKNFTQLWEFIGTFINNERPRTCFTQPIWTKRNSHER